jgi:hypothetical protein
MNPKAVARESRRILHHEGILNDSAVLESVIRLVSQPRPSFAREGQWNYVCNAIEAAYLLGLRVGGVDPSRGAQ